MKGLSSVELNWLCKPDNGDEDERAVYISSSFAIGVDSFRLHAINLSKVRQKVDGHPVKDLVDKFNDAVTVENVRINARFLIDALTCMVDKTQFFNPVTLSIAKGEDNVIAVRLESKDKTAIIMALRDNEDDKSN